MKISARNRFSGTVTSIWTGAVDSTLRIDIGGVIVTSMIADAALEELGPAEGGRAIAVVKASDVRVATR